MYKYHCLNPIADIGLNQFKDEYAAVSHITSAQDFEAEQTCDKQKRWEVGNIFSG